MCAKDEYNAKETMRVLCITNRVKNAGCLQTRIRLVKYCLTDFSATRENSTENISFFSLLFEKHPKALSKHLSPKACAND